MKFSRFVTECRQKNVGPDIIFEEIIADYYSTTLVPGDTAVDCGAHRGLHLFPLSKIVGENGLVIGFEPMPTYNVALLKRITSYRNILLFLYSLGELETQSDFAVVDNSPGYSGIRQRQIFNASVLNDLLIKMLPVIVVKLDTILRPFRNVRFIKLDLEGGEFDALKGGRDLILNNKPVIVFEHAWHSGETYGYTRKEFFGFFSDIGYTLFDILGNKLSPNVPEFAWYVWGFPCDERESWQEDSLFCCSLKQSIGTVLGNHGMNERCAE